MAEAAKIGKGSFTYIGASDEVAEKMTTLFKRLQHHVLADIQIDFAQGTEFYPSNIPDLYLGQPLMISYKGPSDNNTLKISGSQQQSQWQQEISLGKGGNNTAISKLWARHKIADLTRQKRHAEDKGELKQAITTTALEQHLVSQYTRFCHAQ